MAESLRLRSSALAGVLLALPAAAAGRDFGGDPAADRWPVLGAAPRRSPGQQARSRGGDEGEDLEQVFGLRVPGGKMVTRDGTCSGTTCWLEAIGYVD